MFNHLLLRAPSLLFVCPSRSAGSSRHRGDESEREVDAPLPLIAPWLSDLWQVQMSSHFLLIWVSPETFLMTTAVTCMPSKFWSSLWNTPFRHAPALKSLACHSVRFSRSQLTEMDLMLPGRTDRLIEWNHFTWPELVGDVVKVDGQFVSVQPVCPRLSL